MHRNTKRIQRSYIFFKQLKQQLQRYICSSTPQTYPRGTQKGQKRPPYDLLKKEYSSYHTSISAVFLNPANLPRIRTYGRGLGGGIKANV